MFVDRVTIDVHAGSGGNGCLSFRRERFIPRGGPDGGDGGRGGHVLILAEAGIDSLSPLAHRKLWRATSGGHGQGAKRHGRQGKDLVVKVPPGTIVKDSQEGFILKDLASPGEQLTAARGGKGGRGNTHFKSSTNRAPRQCTPGEKGESRRLELELKVIADVGLVGLPNAGKSTLLSRLSRARPEIADYPFTTKHPNLGRVNIDRDRSFVMADIPGLIQGAHDGHGLGHEFLRHIERTRVLVHLVEPLPTDGSDPIENYHAIRHELVEFNEKLGKRNEIIVMTKAELPDAVEIHQQFTGSLNQEVLFVSAVTGQGLDRLRNGIATTLQRLNASDTPTSQSGHKI